MSTNPEFDADCWILDLHLTPRSECVALNDTNSLPYCYLMLVESLTFLSPFFFVDCLSEEGAHSGLATSQVITSVLSNNLTVCACVRACVCVCARACAHAHTHTHMRV